MQTVGERRGAPLAGLPGGVFVAAGLLLFWIVGKAGQGAHARGERVLGEIDPAMSLLRAAGRMVLPGLWDRRLLVALLVGAIALVFGFLALRKGGGGREPRSFSLLLFGAGLVFAALGETLVLSDKSTLGGSLLGAGMVAAFALGLVSPLRRLAGFPDPRSLSTSGDASAGTENPPFGFPEMAGLFGLTAIGLVVRAWAITELPSKFDAETIYMLNQSATLWGVKLYLQTELLGTGDGIFHLLTNCLFYKLFGASLYTVRVTALFWGTVAIPLFYFLVRRLAGVLPAVLGTVLFVCMPEQLFWSRNENSFFSLVAIVALVTAHLTLWLVRDLSVPAALATALWMPICRFVYTPAFIMFTLPLFMVAHALLFRREARRRSWWLVPAAGAGLALWIFSLTILLYPVRGRWEFIHPAKVRGQVAWRGGIPAEAGPVEIAKIQTKRIATNLAFVVKGFADNTSFSSHWYERAHVSDKHRTDLNAGLLVLAALAAAYFAAQIVDARAALLLVWIGIGLLPAVMSDEPEARRFSLVFPGITVLVTLFLAAAARIARASLGSAAARAAHVALVAGVAAIAFTSLASHLLQPVKVFPQDARDRFAHPLFEHCGTVLHNLFYRDGPTLGLENLNALLAKDSRLCYQRIAQKDWPQAALFPSCTFADEIYQWALPPEDIERRVGRPRPDRVGFLMEETFESQPKIELLMRLYPTAAVRRQAFPESKTALVAIEVEGAEFSRYRGLEAGSREALPKEIFAGVPLEAGPAPAPQRGLTVKGGFLVPSDGYYRLTLQPECPAAEVLAGPERSDGGNVRPFLAGAQPMEIRLPSAGACSLPLRLQLEQVGRRGDAPEAPVEAQLLSPRALAVPGVTAPRLVTEPGFGEATLVASFREIPMDVGVDGAGVPYVLLFRDESWKLRRLGGSPESSFEVEPRVSTERTNVSLAVMPDGSSVVAGPKIVEIRDRDGKLRRSFTIPYNEAAADILVLPWGDLLFCFPYRQTIEVFSQDGTSLSVFRSPESGPGHFDGPGGVALSSRGQLLVLDGMGNAHSFQIEKDVWPPKYVSSFHVDFREIPIGEDECRVIFDGKDRLVFPHHVHRVPLIYTASGERVLAAAPEGDLDAKGFGATTAFASTPEALFVVDRYQKRLYRVARK